MKSAWIAVCMFLLGCAPSWRVISQAQPNPLRGKRELVVAPIDFSDLRVGKKTEAEYLAKKDDKDAQRFVQDKVQMNDAFVAHLTNAAKRGGVTVTPAKTDITTYVVKPHIGFVEPGYFAVVASGPSRVVLRLKIEDKDGKLIDEIELEHESLPNTWEKVSAGSRYREDAENIGDLAGEYLSSRVASDK